MVNGTFREPAELSSTAVPVVCKRVGEALVGSRVEINGFDVRRNSGAIELSYRIGSITSVLRFSPLVAARIGAALVQKGLMS